ncbi:MAG: DUF1449 family protein [Lachnospiraceae bacterium]|nr:DUF1449 family protein [Lachnospiraceae bacterium]
MGELLQYAFTGCNIVPTVLLILIIIYWLSIIIGAIDFDSFDIDLDVDVDADLDGMDDLGPFHALLSFLNVADLPFMLVASILILIFWILAMLIHLLPVKPGGFINVLLFIPALIISIILTKLITSPLKKVMKGANEKEETTEEVVGQLVILTCDLRDGRLAQAEVKREGASILINVRPEFPEQTFVKNEEAYVTKKDDEKDFYYIVKIREW